MKYPIYYLDERDCVTTPEEFCEATGWPEEEWMSLKLAEGGAILALYGLSYDTATLLVNDGFVAGFAAAAKVYAR